MHSGTWDAQGTENVQREEVSRFRCPLGRGRHIPHPGMAYLISYSVIRREHGDPLIEELNPGDALEPEGRGTGEGT